MPGTAVRNTDFELAASCTGLRELKKMIYGIEMGHRKGQAAWDYYTFDRLRDCRSLEKVVIYTMGWLSSVADANTRGLSNLITKRFAAQDQTMAVML